jgi:acetyl esterase/lipase
LNVLSNQEYARPDGIPLLFDLYHPGGGELPLVVFLHGGGWISGEREMYGEEAHWFANYGFATATVDYRLAPLYPFPAAVEDAESFVAFIRENRAKYRVTDKIGAMGNSAGGHLAAMLGVTGRVDAVVDVCGLTDMRNPGETQYPISMSFIEQFLGGPYAGNEDAYAQASPLAHIDGDECPFLIVHGSEDDVVPATQSTTLHEGLVAQGRDARLLMLEGEGHSFSIDAWDRIRSEAAAFFKEKLR